jgi:uncharacterized OsmC-like protein
MPTIPGTIALGKFRVVYEEEREQGSGDSGGYLVQQRAIIRLNEELVKLAQQEDYAVYYDDENFKKQSGKRPSPLQYLIASIGFCMFSQLRRFAATAEVTIDDLEMDLRMTYDLTGKFPIKNFSDAAHGISYIFKIKSPSSLENVIKVAQAADKGCHTVNSMRKRMPVSGKLILNDWEYEIRD